MYPFGTAGLRNNPDMPAVRSATLADASRLAELSAALGYPVPVSELAATLERLLSRQDHAILVAVMHERIVGWIHVAEREVLEIGRLAEILGLVVDASARRQRVGQRLVAAAEAWATARDLPAMTVRSNVIRAESHPFYEALGYARIKTQHTYRKLLVS